jgi:hypothetical protein
LPPVHYDSAVSIEEIRTLKHAKPFRPFDIVTKDGRKLRIPLEHRIALSPRGDSVTGFAVDGSFFLPLSEIAEVKAQSGRRTKKP